jgi:hypothetical protein
MGVTIAKTPTIEQLRMLALRVKLRRTSGVPKKGIKCILLRTLINLGNREEWERGMPKAPTVKQLKKQELRVKLRRTSGVPEKGIKCILLRTLINLGNRRCYIEHWKAGRVEESKESKERL